MPVFSSNLTIDDSLYGSGGWDALSVQEHSNSLYSFLKPVISISKPDTALYFVGVPKTVIFFKFNHFALSSIFQWRNFFKIVV